MKKIIAILALLSIVLIGCEKDDGILGGAQSPQGEVGNTFTASTFIQGIENISAEVIELNDGVSTIRCQAQVTNQLLRDLVDALLPVFPAQVSLNGDIVTVDAKARFTKNGIAAVFPEGELTLVEYDAKVGDEYSLVIDGKKVTNKVVSRSVDDDYFWGGWLIKVIEVESTGQGLPGLNKVTYFANHRFGLVGVSADFGGSGVLQSDIFSDANN